MQKELELWQFVAERVQRGERVMLLVVAESSGSSPGRAGYKMAVASDGELSGSIGGGVMEVNLVEQSRQVLSEVNASKSALTEQVHRENSPNASGMICSGKQTVIFRLLTSAESDVIGLVLDALVNRRPEMLVISPDQFSVGPPEGGTLNDFRFEKLSDTEFRYAERLGHKNDLYIVGGGHCALALSELMSKMDFHISLFDDRPDLNTIDKNRFANRITIVDGYDEIADEIPDGPSSYVVVMTLGYASDERVIRSLIEKEFKYFGVLGSSAKMSVMLRKLLKEGLPAEKLDRIRTPIGLPIRSRTPDEIAVSIAAEIISVKNA